MPWTIPLSSRRRLTYHVDGLVLGMFGATLLDVATTYLILSRMSGFEMNPVCARLLRHSLIWLPVYLMSFPLVVPLLPDRPRRAISLYFLASRLLFGLNNISGILFQNYFIIDNFGFWLPEAVCVLGACAFFAYELHRNPTNRFYHIRMALSGLGVLLMMQGLFYGIGYILK